MESAPNGTDSSRYRRYLSSEDRGESRKQRHKHLPRREPFVWLTRLSFWGCKYDLPGFTFDYLLGLLRDSTSHSLPIHEGLAFHSDTLNDRGNEVDPLSVVEGVEIGVKLLRLGVLGFVGCCCLPFHTFRYVGKV